MRVFQFIGQKHPNEAEMVKQIVDTFEAEEGMEVACDGLSSEDMQNGQVKYTLFLWLKK